ncbi:hypothetical protein ACXR2U_05840 [Jatrophihabitans sp. YIM 134969]
MSAPRRPRPGPGLPADPAPVPADPVPTDPVPADPAPVVDVEAEPPLPGALTALGIVGVVVVAALGALVSVLLTPARIGTTLVPFAVVVAVALNIALPVLACRLSGSRGVAALPVLVFFVAGWALSISPGGDVLLAGGSDGQTAISYATLLGGVLIGAVTAVRTRP